MDQNISYGFEAVEKWFNELYPTYKADQVEFEFNLDLGENFPFELKGFMDVITEDGVIIDHKIYSPYSVPSQAELDKDLQLSVYALAYRLHFGKEEIGLREDMMIKKKDGIHIKTMETKRTQQQLDIAIEIIEGVATAIQNNIFIPNPNGWHCSEKWCLGWHECLGKNIF